MGDKTGIQWTDATWNPIRGCSRVSEGCRNCYAETVANRFKGPGQPYEGLIARGGQWSGNITVADAVMDQPLRWRKPRRIFVNSMSDLFHENVPDQVIARIFQVMYFAEQHTFQVLTKRPERMRDFLNGCGNGGGHGWITHNGEPTEAYGGSGIIVGRSDRWPLLNVQLGVSVESQPTADERIPLLLQTPAAVRWISAEPLLGRVDLCEHLGMWWNQTMGVFEGAGAEINRNRDGRPGIGWVVVGGESGTGARPMHPDWVRTLRNQCQAAGVPFFFKQWGEWVPVDRWPNDFKATAIRIDGSAVPIDVVPEEVGGHRMQRVGKKLAGRLLDGSEWNEYPVVAA